ncbi:hypothetical protein, partial [Synechococcus sp. MU1655]|uniref:hypothetical protein n=1 Tax=Synechococcus sp. MU1655 TaxID=2508355 RepID=UPI0020270B3C
KKRLWELIAAPFSESRHTSELRVRRIEGLRSCGKLLFDGQQASAGGVLAPILIVSFSFPLDLFSAWIQSR